MSETSWDLIEQRLSAKRIKDEAKTRAFRNLAERDHNKLNKAVKLSCKKDKRKMYDELATAAESAAESKDLRVLYDKSSGKRFHQVRPIKEQKGNLLTGAQGQIKRWKNHFCEVMNPNTSGNMDASHAKAINSICKTRCWS